MFKILFLIVTFLFTANIAFADHEASVAGQVVPLADVSLSHGKNCDDIHYHGELNGVSDPNPEGCGHGIVTILPHNEDDESIVPEAETVVADDGPGFWSRVGGFFGDAFDVVAQMFGAPPPKTIYESVEIVEEAAPSIQENIETIEEYRESVDEDEDTLGIFSAPDEGLEEGSLSQRFFRWLNNLTN